MTTMTATKLVELCSAHPRLSVRETAEDNVIEIRSATNPARFPVLLNTKNNTASIAYGSASQKLSIDEAADIIDEWC